MNRMICSLLGAIISYLVAIAGGVSDYPALFLIGALAMMAFIARIFSQPGEYREMFDEWWAGLEAAAQRQAAKHQQEVRNGR